MKGGKQMSNQTFKFPTLQDVMLLSVETKCSKLQNLYRTFLKHKSVFFKYCFSFFRKSFETPSIRLGRWRFF